MIKKDIFLKNKSAPICTGTGLIALDIVLNKDNVCRPLFMTGGSCGNVHIILAYLGWRSIPISRLKDNICSEFILEDMKKWGVDLSYITFDNKASTPVIIEKLKKTQDRDLTHSFSFVCPECKSFLPRFRPIPSKQIDTLIPAMPQSDVCYIDRVSSGALKLAKICKDNGGLIFFEPTKIYDNKQFLSILEITDVLKYSRDASIIDNHILKNMNTPLIIETQGSLGLRYCITSNHATPKKWNKLPAFPVSNIIDTAGAGDWCSAGIVHRLQKEKSSLIEKMSAKSIENALIFGQALAALNCMFIGARGCMYALSKKNFQQYVNEILSYSQPNVMPDMQKLAKPKFKKGNCKICNEPL